MAALGRSVNNKCHCLVSVYARPSKPREYAREAGFADVEILPIENDFWRFYRLI